MNHLHEIEYTPKEIAFKSKRLSGGSAGAQYRKIDFYKQATPPELDCQLFNSSSGATCL